MSAHQIETPVAITPEYLSTLDKGLIIDLLQHKTNLLMAAKKGALSIPDYIKALTGDIKTIQKKLMGKNQPTFDQISWQQ